MVGMYKQSRRLGGPVKQSYSFVPAVGNPQLLTTPIVLPEFQETWSYRSGSRYPDVRKPDMEEPPNPSTFDTGHEFSTFKRTIHCNRSFSASKTTPYGEKIAVTAPVLIRDPRVNSLGDGCFYDPGPMSENDVRLLGTRFIKAAIPTSPSFSLTRFIGELKKDGLPALPLLGMQSRRTGSKADSSGIADNANLRTVGGEYLNGVFGWAPVLSDLRGLLEVVVSASSVLEQYRKDSGKVVRRRLSWAPEITSSSYTVPTQYGRANFFGYIANGELVDNGFSVRDVTVTDRKVVTHSFSGAFSYYLDVGDDALSRLKRYEQYANKLLGTRLTPGVVYDLTPWSWLVDWFGEFGDILHNASSLSEDGLVIRYGYLMRKTRADRYLSVKGGPGTPHERSTFYTNYRTERKERYRATPFGFGLKTADFSNQQWAILAALGMSRSPKSWT